MSTSDELDAQIKAERQRELAEGVGLEARRARYNAKRANQNHKITACPQGHPYDDKNTYINASGRRMCLVCHAARRVHKDRHSSNRLYNKGKPVIDLTDFIHGQEPDGPYETR